MLVPSRRVEHRDLAMQIRVQLGSRPKRSPRDARQPEWYQGAGKRKHRLGKVERWGEEDALDRGEEEE